MARRVLDTNILINYWGDRSRGRKSPPSLIMARLWGDSLVLSRNSNAIVTPVFIEYVCGRQDERAPSLARSFLAPFEIVDEGRIIAQDWVEARRIAQRVLRDRSPRQLGDCLIRAIRDRLHYEVDTADLRFPR